jgi:hypothetical protein
MNSKEEKMFFCSLIRTSTILVATVAGWIATFLQHFSSSIAIAAFAKKLYSSSSNQDVDPHH